MKRIAPDADADAHSAPPVPASASQTRSHWQACLTVGFANDRGTTRMVERSHVGPLRIQKPLYPEGPQVCHAIIVHPLGGVVGGDQLTVHAAVGTASHALIATPGAAKWYKANGHVSRQEVRLTVGADAHVDRLDG